MSTWSNWSAGPESLLAGTAGGHANRSIREYLAETADTDIVCLS